MADVDDKKTQDDVEAKDSSESTQDAAKIGIITWAILAVIVVIFAGSGFFLGRLFAGPSLSEASKSSQEKAQIEEITPDLETGSNDTWYYDLEPVVANLDEPSVTRYVRAAIKLEINSAMEQDKCEKHLEDKKPILTNWLTIYLAGLTLEDARGDRNLKRIQSQILDAFNEKLFPDAKPQIKRILFNEFVVN